MTEEKICQEDLKGNEAPEAEVVTEAAEPTAEEQLAAKMKELEDTRLRVMADFDNYKKRAQKEKETILKYAATDVVMSLLPVLDNLDRAIEAVPESDREDAFYKGVVLIDKMFEEALTKNGVEEIPALGQPFNPEVHQAVVTEEVEGVEENTVTAVLAKGYTLQGRVLRPSMVKVSK